MRTFIPTWQRPLSIKTHRLFPPHADYTVVCGTKFEASDYKLNSTLPKEKIVISGTGFGIGRTRQWILNQVPEGEWFCMMDDNVERVTYLQNEKESDMSWSMFETWRQ